MTKEALAAMGFLPHDKLKNYYCIGCTGYAAGTPIYNTAIRLSGSEVPEEVLLKLWQAAMKKASESAREQIQSEFRILLGITQ